MIVRVLKVCGHQAHVRSAQAEGDELKIQRLRLRSALA